MRIAGYDELRREQAERRQQAAASGDPASQSYMGIGLAFFTEGVGAGPRKHMDILGLGMADGCDLRVHPTGKAQLRLSVQTQGQGHETTFAQIVSHQLGIPPEDVEVIHGDTDNTPFGLGTYGSRSTPVSGAAAAVVSQRVRDKARIVAAAALECDAADLEWDHGRWQVVGNPTQGKSISEIAMLAHSSLELPEGVEGHLDAQAVYNPPDLTYPFGAYICVVDVDAGTGVVKVRRFIAVDDCGPRINPMIVEGQIHGGLVDGIGMALMQAITFDEDGNCLGGSFMDYLLPTSMEVPNFELGETVTPSPHHPLGVKGVGESATVGSPAAVVNAVIDALAPLGVKHADMPLTPAQVWLAIQGRPARTDLAVQRRDWTEASLAELRRPARSVRSRPRRPRRAADERSSRRRGDRPGGRDDRGVRRRRLRRVDGARPVPHLARLRRVDRAADQSDSLRTRCPAR